MIIKLAPSPINIRGINILISNPKNSPIVIETPVKVNMIKVKTIENIKAMIEIKHPNTILFSFLPKCSYNNYSIIGGNLY